MTEQPGFSGFIIVLLASKVRPDGARDLQTMAKEQGLDDVTEMLAALDNPPTERLIKNVEPDRLVEQERRAARRGGGPGPQPQASLARFWRVDVRARDEDWPALAERIAERPSVETAYAELAVEDPRVHAQNNPRSQRQRYLNAAPLGVDARWAWTRRGGAGGGVSLAVVEAGWTLKHEDLVGRNVTLIANDNRPDGRHGTAVMGVLTAEDNAAGVVGIVPSLDNVYAASRYRAADTGLHVAEAITAAMGRLSPGDILLLEVTRNKLPTETDLGDRTAIQNAVLSGLVVVAAAGNGARDLDNNWPERLLGVSPSQVAAGALESGAILVGAGRSAVVNGTHDRDANSNYGGRVDCFAWGDRIVTTGGDGDLSPGAAPEHDYTALFGGTSGAAAIVAGVAAATQGMHRAAGHGTLSPAEMRAILRDPALGTARPAGVPDPIGPMPDLRRIGTVRFVAAPLP